MLYPIALQGLKGVGACPHCSIILYRLSVFGKFHFMPGYSKITVMTLRIPKEVKEAVKALIEAGYEAYLVGGCVRDLTLGKTPKDWDIATNARPEEIQKIFPDNVYENNFGTVGVKTRSEDPAVKILEVTTFRLDGEYGDFRHPKEVRFVSTIEEDDPLGRPIGQDNLHELVPYPLLRYAVQKARLFPDRLKCFLLYFETQLDREPHRPHEAQRVFVEALMRIADGTNDFLLQIFFTAERIN